MMDYEKMLDRLYMSLPKEALMKERFELTEPDSFIQGNKTVVKNFSVIIKQIRREPVQMMKFLTKELATPATIDNERLILNTKLSRSQVSAAFLGFVKQYVLCSVCGKPDTHFEEKQGAKILKCEACGAHTAIKKL
jgi:translation initiation factor 2 subunit 2